MGEVDETRRAHVVDANVLIDYLESDPAVLSLISKHLGQVYVSTAVAREVYQLRYHELEQLDVVVCELTLEQAIDAEVLHGRISYPDATCFVLARDFGWICISNDR
ncbi:MAG: hypothetical protein K6T31_02545 [Alicyclobacillus sp.]|nr:hypothetical protein [Alicyclobacillus sp.]